MISDSWGSEEAAKLRGKSKSVVSVHSKCLNQALCRNCFQYFRMNVESFFISNIWENLIFYTFKPAWHISFTLPPTKQISTCSCQHFQYSSTFGCISCLLTSIRSRLYSRILPVCVAFWVHNASAGIHLCSVLLADTFSILYWVVRPTSLCFKEYWICVYSLFMVDVVTDNLLLYHLFFCTTWYFYFSFLISSLALICLVDF